MLFGVMKAANMQQKRLRRWLQIMEQKGGEGNEEKPMRNIGQHE